VWNLWPIGRPGGKAELQVAIDEHFGWATRRAR
jgi:hypothetical protein